MTDESKNGKAPETSQIEGETTALVARLNEFAIQTDEDYQLAGDHLKLIKVTLSKIDEVFDPIIKAAHATHKSAIERKKFVSSPVEELNRNLRRLAGDYALRKEREREAEERKVREEARRLEEERLLAEAEDLEEAGQHDAAEAILEQPVQVAPVVTPAATPKVDGVSTRKTYTFRVTNPARIKAAFLMPDEKRIGQIVRSMGPKAVEIVGDGIVVEEKRGISVRG